jgi:hypothetical protein
MPMAQAVRSEKTARHYGKFRGIVSDNNDPKKLGRLRAKVPEILGDVESGWALPCAPYAGKQSGLFEVPSNGTGVWIEFESGVVSRPIWTGCWWGSGDIPQDEQGSDATPDLKILRSESGLMVALHDDDKSIAVSDQNGQNLLHIEVQSGKITVNAATKVVVNGPQIELVSGAGHPLVFGDDLLQYLSEIVTIFNVHMHPGELAIGVLPVTPMVPVAQMTPPTPSLLSLQVKTG